MLCEMLALTLSRPIVFVAAEPPSQPVSALVAEGYIESGVRGRDGGGRLKRASLGGSNSGINFGLVHR